MKNLIDYLLGFENEDNDTWRTIPGEVSFIAETPEEPVPNYNNYEGSSSKTELNPSTNDIDYSESFTRMSATPKTEVDEDYSESFTIMFGNPENEKTSSPEDEKTTSPEDEKPSTNLINKNLIIGLVATTTLASAATIAYFIEPISAAVLPALAIINKTAIAPMMALLGSSLGLQIGVIAIFIAIIALTAYALRSSNTHGDEKLPRIVDPNEQRQLAHNKLGEWATSLKHVKVKNGIYPGNDESNLGLKSNKD